MSFEDSRSSRSWDAALRKGSLPTSLARGRPPSDEQFTGVQSPRAAEFKPSNDDFRSFLYLDLADSEASVRRKASTRRPDVTTSFLHITSPDSFSFRQDEEETRLSSPDFSELLSATLRFDEPGSLSLGFPSVPVSPLTPHTPMSSASTFRRRRSRDSLRYVPSPKPVPSTTLPPVPHLSPTRTRKTSRPAPLNLPTSPVSPSLPSSSCVSPETRHRASHSAPTILSPTSDSSRPSSPFSAPFIYASFADYEFPSPPPIGQRDRRASMISSLTRGSSITSNQRKASRSNALASLEGRSNSPNRIARFKTNFMSMSDDEDDEDDGLPDIEERPARERESVQLQDVMLMEDEDVVIPRSAVVPSSSSSQSTNVDLSRPPTSGLSLKPRPEPLPLSQPLPASRPPYSNPLPSPAPSSPRTSSNKSGRRRSTMESWFPPLSNFIDLAEDASTDMTKWRSFVEIGSA